MSTQPVQIVARIRPPLLNEQIDDAISVVPIPADNALTDARPIPFTSWVSVSSTGSKTGTTQIQNSQTAFHTAFGPDTSQLELFDTAVAPHIAPLLKGYTLTILAYGPTSSGKTHTMEGTSTEPGIIPRSVQMLFNMSEEGKKSGSILGFELHMSYLELYKDDAFDLLVSQRTHDKLPIRTNAKGETFVVGLTRVLIKSYDDWKNVFRTASQNRTTGATLLNRASSRSHAMLSIEIEVVTAATSETRETTYNGKINLVDLAGSENNKHTGNSLANPTRLAESAAINKSLSTLGQVVHALNTGASRIPYRDSNLTRLLSASLGGKALGKTILLCNLAPGVKFRSDVLNTLNFASRTKNIETKTVVNEREKPAPVEIVKEKEIIVPLMRRTSIQSRRASASHIPAPGSRIPSYGANGHSRMSGFGPGLSGLGGGGGMTSAKAEIDDADLNKRISKAVEAEVKRRLEEQEAQRKLEEEKDKRPQDLRQNISSSSSSSSAILNQEAPVADVNTEQATEDVIKVKVEEAEVETELRVVESMDIDEGHLAVGGGALDSSPMRVDLVKVPTMSDCEPDENHDPDKEKMKMEDLERKYREHIAQLEAQLAAASSSSAAASTSTSACITADGAASMFSASISSSSSLSVSASGSGAQSVSSSAHVLGNSENSRASHHSLTSAAQGLLNSTDDAESIEKMTVAERKRRGKIYLDLARGFSAKNDPATALLLYRDAALFLPDNAKLRERIIDFEWAVKHGKAYVPTPKRQHPREPEEKLKPKSHRSSRSASCSSRHIDEKSKENSSSYSSTVSESPRKSHSTSSAELKPEVPRASSLSLTGSKRKRSVSQEPTEQSDLDYVFVANPCSSKTGHGPGHGFGKDLGNIDEEVEAETGSADAEVDEFGVSIVPKGVLRRSPRKKQAQQGSEPTLMKSPTIADKRKMLGMSLSGLGGIDPYRTPSGGIGWTTTAPIGGANESTRKTRKVSDLVYSGLEGLGFSGRAHGEEGVDVDVHGKKRARLD